MTTRAERSRLGVMITVEGLTKKYAGFTAVDDVSFVCRPGAVTGFLGPNGAGKTTTMRVMAGLTLPTSGKTLVSGVEYRQIPNPGTQVGVLLDASAQHAGRTGREILAISAATMGLPSSRIDEMLELVSLTPAEAKRRVKNYSLGMRQRLGIANALLGDPKILILDEPANGLDPAGIHWMRSLLREYANRGGTVLLSSHLLHEIEVIADEIIVIGNGRIVAQGTKAELLHTAGTFVKAGDSSALANALTAAGVSASPSGDGGLRTETSPEQVGKIAAAAGVALVELRPAEGAGLEEMFLELTAGTQREAVTTEGASA
jgi:ABC-2 type transport system ATP-binding protein